MGTIQVCPTSMLTEVEISLSICMHCIQKKALAKNRASSSPPSWNSGQTRRLGYCRSNLFAVRSRYSPRRAPPALGTHAGARSRARARPVGPPAAGLRVGADRRNCGAGPGRPAPPLTTISHVVDIKLQIPAAAAAAEVAAQRLRRRSRRRRPHARRRPARAAAAATADRPRAACHSAALRDGWRRLARTCRRRCQWRRRRVRSGGAGEVQVGVGPGRMGRRALAAARARVPQWAVRVADDRRRWRGCPAGVGAAGGVAGV